MTHGRSKALWRAVTKNSDKALFRFFEGLQQKHLLVTRCHSCETLHYPPQRFCPDCLNEEIEFVKHSGRGSIYAFTTMAVPPSGGEQITVAMVELEGVEGRMFARVAALYEELFIGMPVEIDYFEREGILLPWFRPVASGS